jgi:hypothetical protein
LPDFSTTISLNREKLLAPNDVNLYLTYQHCHRYDQALLNTMIARMLFDNNGYAAQYGYLDNHVIIDSDKTVQKIFEKRKQRYLGLNEMWKLERGDMWKQPLTEYMCKK